MLDWSFKPQYPDSGAEASLPFSAFFDDFSPLIFLIYSHCLWILLAAINSNSHSTLDAPASSQAAKIPRFIRFMIHTFILENVFRRRNPFISLYLYVEIKVWQKRLLVVGMDYQKPGTSHQRMCLLLPCPGALQPLVRNIWLCIHFSAKTRSSQMWKCEGLHHFHHFMQTRSVM